MTAKFKKIVISESHECVIHKDGNPAAIVVEPQRTGGSNRQVLVPLFTCDKNGIAIPAKHAELGTCLDEDFVEKQKEILVKHAENKIVFFYEFRAGRFIGLAGYDKPMMISRRQTQ